VTTEPAKMRSSEPCSTRKPMRFFPQGKRSAMESATLIAKSPCSPRNHQE
jgi:hypothetical protein